MITAKFILILLINFIINNDIFPDEILPNPFEPCFQGAYYRKAMTSLDKWYGISGIVKLPKIEFDRSRINPLKPHQYLDNPSIYLGGNVNNQETDIGLTWEVIRDSNGNITPDRRAFRPFIRWSYYRETNQRPGYRNAPTNEKYYWYPGNIVSISVKTIKNQTIYFIIEGEGKKYETEVKVDGYNLNSFGNWKRVNALDQVSNEGKPVQPTKTKLFGSIWNHTKLYRKVGDEIIETYMHKKRFTDMRCPKENYFFINSNSNQENIGGEEINIDCSR
jgi:hypothetical protein